jgi:alpha-L-fucosidase 2
LQWVLDGLLTLPESEVSDALRTEWRTFRQLLPPLPTRTDAIYNRTKVLPALQYDHLANFENPELYAIFPYRLFGVGKPDLEVGHVTWEAREMKRTGGWCQDAIQAALLGLTDEAAAAVVKIFSTSHEESRFPAFWGPGFDWIPDQCHGSVGCAALQRMLLQCDAGAIHLLPAWPADWNVEFRLHAPDRTIVEGTVKNGKLLQRKVIPEERDKNVVVMEPA